MIEKWVQKFHAKPLRNIILLAFLVRLIAVFFAKGYAMHDDQFLTIEPASSWAYGLNNGDWLPGIGNTNEHPEPISFFYLGFLFVCFKILRALDIENPDTQMFYIRFLQAVYSLLTVYYAYKITERLSGTKNAIQVGLLLALMAIVPNFSVRNLVEFTCMPPLLIGFWLLLSNFNFAGSGFKTIELADLRKDILNWKFIGAAIAMGLAVGLRFQTGLLVALVGLMLLLQRGILSAIVFGFISFSAFFLTQIDDVLLWGGQPFQHLQGYFSYNSKNANNYPGSPFAYLSLIALYILPPVSLFLMYGFFRQWKKQAMIFIPIFGFLIFHIVYPNRQERFILPALPFIVMLGVIGWNEFILTSQFWARRKQVLQFCFSFFWVINIAGMLVFCFTYSKKARVEAMLYLYHQGDCVNFVREATHSDGASMPPQFYSGHTWPAYYYWNDETNVEEVIAGFPLEEEQFSRRLHKKPIPNYYLFYDDAQLESRVNRIKQQVPTLTYATTIEAGWFDKLLHSLNEKNAIEKIHIYKVE
ncbi:MAG: hypothetical protein ACKVOK_05680 [Flavobacteriales bacterium]